VRHLGAVFFAAILLAPAGAPRASSPTIDYIYADANEGGASGGHAAIRFGDEVFHFEYRAPRMIRLRRDQFEGWRYRYTVLDNRTLVLHRIPVSEETYRLLRDEFRRRQIVQDQYLRAQAALVADRHLLDVLRAARPGHVPDEPVVLAGGGFFFDEARIPAIRSDWASEPSTGAPPRHPAAALLSLRDRVATTHGPGFIDETMERILRRLSALVPEERDHPVRELSASWPTAVSYDFSGRYQDLLLSLFALAALRDALPLRMDGVAGAGGQGPALEGADVELIGRLGEALESSLVRLVRSSRPDWGFPLLVGMARLVALDEARRAGRWMFLDAFAPDALVIPADLVRERPELTQALLEEAREDFAAARARIADHGSDGDGFPEGDFADLEAVGNRLIEVGRAVDGKYSMRLAFGLRVPSRDAVISEPIVPAISPEELAQHAARARAREEAHEARLRRLYGYDLLTRNCVTEIFRTIDAALATALPDADPARIRLESRRRLGGYVEVERTLNFIPVASARAVREAYAVAETLEIPSYRLSGLARLYRRNNALGVFLQESNTLTSTLYRRNPIDSAFLFFTDDVVSLRPLLGLLNVATGLGVSATGLFTVPVDGGEMLRAGLKGVLFSLPELAFFNIRKGSLPFAPRR